MKPYQHHDEVQDQGKAVPKPKRPTHHTYRGRGACISFERTTINTHRDQLKKDKPNKFFGIVDILKSIFKAQHKQ